MKLILSTISLTFCLILLLSFNNDTEIINGIIMDSSGSPLIGASVLEKGTTNGTITDFDGKFSLTISKYPSTLIVSYTGFETKEVTCTKQTNFLKIKLAEGALLEECVVVGNGRKRKMKLRKASNDMVAPSRPPAIMEGDVYYDYEEIVKVLEENRIHNKF